MRVLAQRWAMVGGGWAYEVYVPKCDAPEHNRKADANGNTHTTVILDVEIPKARSRKCEYLRYEDATASAEQQNMPQGWERYESRMAHDRLAESEKLAIISRAYPEASEFPRWPSLWVCIDLPEGTPRHSDTWLDA